MKALKNPYRLWKKSHVTNLVDAMEYLEIDQSFEIGGFDTETTGLHIKKDKPFLIQVGWLIEDAGYGRVFTFYPTQENMLVFFQLAKRFTYFFAHNLKYDLHMLANIGYEQAVQSMTNLCDSMAIARLALEAVPTREGGKNFSLKLKDLGVIWIHPSANEGESLIKDNLREIESDRINILTAALKQFPIGGNFTATGKQRFWGKGSIEQFLKNPVHDLEDLPSDVRDVWESWLEDYPEATYEDVDRDLMISYGGDDVITMLEFVLKAFETVKYRKQLPVLELERACILPLFRMERIGVKADLVYLEESRKTVKKEIERVRLEMKNLVGETVTGSQHIRLKQLFNLRWNIDLFKCDKANLTRLAKTDAAPGAKRFAVLIGQLRTLEKWYSTYIKRIIKNANYDGNVYTQINSYGAVSGRMSCDFQQFPKKSLKNEKGEELFHPRKAFIAKGADYGQIAFIDYDQIELVTQAHYTLLVSGGDPNLCGAYMPFKCNHYKTGKAYNYEDVKERGRWNEKQPNGESAWLDEEGNPWVKTDVHAQTTHKAFPTIPLGTEEFAEWRSKGKMFNFMANYGGGKGAAMDALDLKEAEADALVRGYNEAFPHVRRYQKAIQTAHRKRGYVVNHYGRRYYLVDSNSSYKLANYNIQGTCADALKDAIVQLDAFLIDKKTNIVMPVHDELQFDIAKGEEHILPILQKIMQDAFSWSLVPVTAGIEVSSSNWASKKNLGVFAWTT